MPVSAKCIVPRPYQPACHGGHLLKYVARTFHCGNYRQPFSHLYVVQCAHQLYDNCMPAFYLPEFVSGYSPLKIQADGHGNDTRKYRSNRTSGNAIRARMSKIDVLRIIPLWRLFAPRPLRSDFCVLSRALRPEAARLYTKWMPSHMKWSRVLSLFSQAGQSNLLAQ